jgi:hypothetical protein
MRSLWLPVLTGLILITGCATDQPTAPASSTTIPFDNAPVAVSCPTPTMIRAQITALFPRPVKLAVGQAFYLVIQAALAKNNVPLAQQVMFAFLKYALYEYQHGGLIGGTSATTQANLTTLTTSLYCVVGLPAPVIPPSALGPDGAIAIVDPSSPTTTLVTATGTAGATIPAGAAPVQTIITINRLPDTPGPLLTPLDQYPAYYQYTASPPVTFSQDVIVGVCQVSSFLPPDFARLRIAHNVPDPGPTTIEILPLASATFLSPTICNSPFSSLDRRGGVLQYVMGTFTRIVSDVLLPEPIQATSLGTCCLGGTTKNFSPFGAVDTLLNVSAVSPNPVFAPAGSAVPSTQLPSVRVLTPTGRPVQGLTVTFSIPAAAPGAITGTTQLTDVNGVATVGSWTLGSASQFDTVYATVSAPHLRSGVGGNPVTFQAQPTAVPAFNWGATGWSWRSLSTYPTVPDQATILSQAVSSSAGYSGPDQAPFIDIGIATICGNTSNNASVFPVNGIVAFRRDFVMPTGATTGTIYFAMDNDFKVFVNGTDMTTSVALISGSTGIYASGIEAGFINHDGCASQGSFSLALSGLSPVTNSVVVVALDRGGETYFDASLTPYSP